MPFSLKPLPLIFAALGLGAAPTSAIAAGALEGRVVVEQSQGLSQQAVLSIDALDLQVMADKSGRFRFPSLPAGEYKLDVSIAGQLLTTKTIRIEDDSVNKQSINLKLDNAVVYEEVIVLGQARRMQRALDRQRFADGIVNALNADSIGQLPDNNMAEALQRVAGISIERDQGEGRFVRIRGVSPDLNSVSVNGTQLPAPESGRRAVALDVVPSALLNSVIVHKTLTPDMDANAIGGNIEVESLSAFERKQAFYSVRAQGSYDELTSETSPAFSLTGGNVFNRDGDTAFGVVGALSWDQRKFGSDNVETGGAWDFDDGEALLEEVEQRDYSLERERLGAAINMDLAFGDNHRLFLRTLYSEFSDVEQRLANVLEFGEEELNDENELEFDGAGRAAGDTGLAEVEREIKDREETQTIIATSLGGDHFLNDEWRLEYALSHAEAGEEEPGGLDSAVFSGGEIDGLGFTNSKEPRLISGEDYYNAANYELDEIEYSISDTDDTQTSFKMDVSREFFWGSRPVLMKFGFKQVQREKTQDATIYVYEDFGDNGVDDADLLMSNYTSGSVDYGIGRFGPAIQPSGLYALINTLPRDDFFNEEDSRVEDHQINEDIIAAYWMGRLDIDKWRVLGGLRYESTEHELNGTEFDSDENYKPLNAENDYKNVLPNLQMRYQLNAKTQIRAAWTNAVVRPTFEQMAPSLIDDGEEAELGNPQLDPQKATNFDIGIEQFRGEAGVLSAFFFHKTIDDFIFSTDLAGTSGWEGYGEVVTFENGQEATLTGIELGYSQKFDFLPKPFSGLIISANATFSDSEATIEASDEGTLESREISLPNHSDTTGNLVLGYESEKLEMRLAFNYKSSYLLEVDDLLDSSGDIYQSEQTQVDFSAHYRFSNAIRLSFEAANLTDEPYYTYVNSSRYNSQYEDYGPTFRFAVSYSSF